MLSWPGVEQVDRRHVAQALPATGRRCARRRRARAAPSVSAGEHARARVLVDGASPSTRPATHVHPAAAGPVGQGAAQGGRLHLLGRPLGVVARRAGRGRRHRRRTAARGSSPGGRGRCPSGGRACAHRRGPRRGSWSSCVPWRAAASWATTTWCISGTLTCTSKISAGSSTVPAFLPVGVAHVDACSCGHRLARAALDGGADEDQAAGRAGHRALDEQQAALGVDRVDRRG